MAEDSAALAKMTTMRTGIATGGALLGALGLAIVFGMSLVALCRGLAELIVLKAGLQPWAYQLLTAAFGLVLSGAVVGGVFWAYKRAMLRQGEALGIKTSSHQR